MHDLRLNAFAAPGAETPVYWILAPGSWLLAPSSWLLTPEFYAKGTFMIMSGAKDATIRQVQLIDIHGTRFYDIAFSHDEAPESVHSARIGTESAYEQPRPGDLVRVSYLMNVVTGITRRTA